VIDQKRLESLKATALNEPQDDEPRRILSDFFKESGYEDRGLFIDVQLALAGMSYKNGARRELEEREAALYAELMKDPIFRAEVTSISIMEGVTVTAEGLTIRPHRGLAGTVTVSNIVLLQARPIAEYIRNNRISGLEIEIRPNQMDILQSVLQNPELRDIFCDITRLKLVRAPLRRGNRRSTPIAIDGITMEAILSPASPLRELTHLSICNLFLNSDSAGVIGASPKLSRLHTLELDNCRITNARLSQLNVGKLQELELLLLPGNTCSFEYLDVRSDTFLPRLARLVIENIGNYSRDTVDDIRSEAEGINRALSLPKMAECSIEVANIIPSYSYGEEEADVEEDTRLKTRCIEEHNDRIARGRGGYIPHMSAFERTEGIERTNRGNLSDFLTNDVLSPKSARNKNRESDGWAR